MGMAINARPVLGRPRAARWGRGVPALAGALLASALSLCAGCSDESYFHLLRPSDEPSGGRSGSGGAQVGGTGGHSPGEAGAGGASEPTLDSLIHRYDFEGTGTVLIDRVGGKDGDIRGGAELTGTGWLTLDGNDDYVALPAGLISSLTSMTIAVWVEWNSVASRCWQRIFDFGNNDAGVQGDAGNVTSAIVLTPSDCPHHSVSALLDFADGGQSIRATQTLPADVSTFVALVFSNPEERFELYLDGARVAGDETRPARLLQEIDDVNNWLGRSQWIQDQVVFFRGSYDEFRIYDRGLSAAEIAHLAERGPDDP